MSEKGSNNNFFIYLTTSFDCKMKPGVATDLDLPRFYLFIYLFIYLSSAKNILHKARKRHNINKYRNTGRGDATAMPITALPRSKKQITDRKI